MLEPGWPEDRTSSAVNVSMCKDQEEIIIVTYRDSAWIGFAIDRNLLDVAVGRSSRSKSQSRNSGDDRVLCE